jgi:hypothetical protein
MSAVLRLHRRRRALAALGVFSCFAVAPTFAVASEAKPFGIERFSLQTTIPSEVPEDTGSGEKTGFRVVNEPYVFTQAGGHPVALTTTILFDSEQLTTSSGEVEVVPTQDPKDVAVTLPAGLIGDPQAVPQCSLTSVTHASGACPADTQVGMVQLRYSGGSKGSLGPIYNVTPEAGQSAEFALVTRGVKTSASSSSTGRGPRRRW